MRGIMFQNGLLVLVKCKVLFPTVYYAQRLPVPFRPEDLSRPVILDLSKD